MTTSYRKLFSAMTAPKAPRGLSDAIMLRIETYEVSRLRRRAFIQGILVAVTLILAVPAIQYLAASAAQSGFGEYFSLVFSDGNYVLSNFRDFMLILADSLPATGTIAILAVGLVLVGALRGMLADLASLSTFRRTTL